MPLSGEDRLLGWLRRRFDLPLLGDDAAVLPSPEERSGFAATVDSQIEGVHYPPGLDPALLARRLLAVNLSDLAAMGATPAFALLALSAAPGFDHRRFFLSFVPACQEAGVTLAGGDLASSPGGTVATLTLLGSRPPRGRWLGRAGAEPGQDLWVGGTVGESAAGRLLLARGARAGGGPGGRIQVSLPDDFEGSAGLLAAARRAVRRHLSPLPQLALGAWLGTQRAGAAMDVSDGLARDLPRLCRASGTGAELIIEALPFARRFTELCDRSDDDPVALGLAGGEDYVLLFTLPAGIEPPDPFQCRKIGRITGRRSIVAIHLGSTHPLPAHGWDHLTKKEPPAPESRGF
ncbi:MAG TPA: thiamine-phosphate kinase [Thermoanaerobaculia bacterium]|nr:thiamine-phosphate kinase [Thermoanaerobaculia bacterium]